MATLIFIFGIILFIGLIIGHEFGHFIIATRNGVKAEEFGIFFGPTLYKRKTKKGWVFKFNLLPLGGYVKLKGEHDSDTQPGSFGAASLWVKSKIMLAGVTANLLIGIFLLMFIAFIGIPQLIPNQFTIKSNQYVVSSPSTYLDVGQVLKNSPAQRAGLKVGDQIVSIGLVNSKQYNITNFQKLQTITQRYQSDKVKIVFLRSGKTLSATTILNSTKEVQSNYQKTKQKVYLGVSVGEYQSGFEVLRYTWSAPLVALGLTKQVIVLTFQGIGSALKGLVGIFSGFITHNKVARVNAQTSASSQLVGPVGIFVILKDGSSSGILFMLFIIAIISLTLAIMNILPIPALDGGRLWFTLLFRALKKPLDERKEEIINATGFVLLILLLGVVTYLDIKRFF